MKQEYPRWLKILVVAMLLPIGWLTYTILTTDMGLTYTLLDEGVQIEQKGFLIMLAEKKLIPYDDITDIQVLERVPKMRKLYGLDGLRTWIGDFTSPEYGRVKVYISNRNWAAIIIKTKNQTYVITPEHAAQFARQMQTKWELRP